VAVNVLKSTLSQKLIIIQRVKALICSHSRELRVNLHKKKKNVAKEFILKFTFT